MTDANVQYGTKAWCEGYFREVIDVLISQAARIADLEAAQTWQPIETAPRQMRHIIGCNADEVSECWWDQDGSFWTTGAGFSGTLEIFKPTHWQPFPAPSKGDPL